jgi:hypothetical protein
MPSFDLARGDIDPRHVVDRGAQRAHIVAQRFDRHAGNWDAIDTRADAGKLTADIGKITADAGKLSADFGEPARISSRSAAMASEVIHLIPT